MLFYIFIIIAINAILYFVRNRRIIPNKGGVVITGASSGIGEKTAIYLDSLGFTVFAGVRNKEDKERIQASFSNRNKSKAIFLEVTSEKSIEEAVILVDKELKGLNIGLIGLVNNAGMAANGPLDALHSSEIRNCMEVNLFGPLNVTNAFLPLLRENMKFPDSPNLPQKWATLIHVGSTMGAISLPFYGPYCMSKYALEAMSDAQRVELGESSGIRVCLMQLGNVQTPIFEKNKTRLQQNLKTMKYMDIYKDHLDMLPHVADVITNGAADPLLVAKAIENALVCASPASRIRVGWEAWVLPIVWKIIPDKIIDKIIILLFNVISSLTKAKSA